MKVPFPRDTGNAPIQAPMPKVDPSLFLIAAAGMHSQDRLFEREAPTKGSKEEPR